MSDTAIAVRVLVAVDTAAPTAVSLTRSIDFWKLQIREPNKKMSF